MRSFITWALVVVLSMTAPFALAGSRGGSSFSSSSSSSRSFSSAPARSSSLSSFRSAPVYKAPSVTQGMSRPTPSVSPVLPTTVNHYYGNNGGSSSGGNMFFWLWLMDRPHPQTVIVNGQPQAVVGSNGAPVYADHSTGDIVMNTAIWLALATIVIVAIVFVVKAIKRRKHAYG